MLEIQKVEWSNFMSYGDYNTEIDVGDLGQCLITGEVDGGDKDMFVDSDIGEIKKSNGAGKCLAEGTLVLLDNGLRVPIEHLEDYIGSWLVGVDNDFKSTKSKLIRHCYSGKKECYNIITQSGYKITGSKNHKFLSTNGWKVLGNLQVGDSIATNKLFHIDSIFNNIEFNRFKAELLGMVMAHGVFTTRLFTKAFADKQNRNRIEELIEYFASTSTFQFNSLFSLIDKFGLTSFIKHQSIPKEIFTSPKEVWINFLDGFWKVSGWVSIKQHEQSLSDYVDIGCNTKSESLIRSLQHLLLRLNIQSRISFVDMWVLKIKQKSYRRFANVFKTNYKVETKYSEILSLSVEGTSKPVDAVDWDEIVHIAKTGYINTYDIEVETKNGEPNFSANDVITHNSTIPNVILWTLFGKTMHSHNPGDKVVNWFTGKDCRCKLSFKNGDEITRTRNTGGKNELIYTRNGDEYSFTSDTLSTTKAQQLKLDRVFGLDWDLFCGSMFFNQYSKPWMEMADQTRKKAIERALHVDRFAYYAKIAKEKCNKIDENVHEKRREIIAIESDIDRLNNETIRLTESLSNFTNQQRERQTNALKDAVLEKKKRDLTQRPDLKQIKEKWDVVSKIQNKITEMEKEIVILNHDIASLNGTESSLKQRIDRWVNKAGKICSACEQEISKIHTKSKIEPIIIESKEIQEQLQIKHKELNIINNKIKQIKILLAQKSPDQTIRSAEEIHKQWERHNKEIKRLKLLAKNIQEEKNPHVDSLDVINNNINKHKSTLVKLKKDIEQIELLNQHYHYIHKAWSDRTKIKSFVFKDHIPFINGRLKHYLDIFGLDVQIELTPALGITSNMWGYEFESGGERKRTDVAFMLAMFDFHEEMHGRQCNILVLDEVDGRLDDDGIDSLIGVIKNDLAPKIESIIIISHRSDMQDVFSREIRVKRSGDCGFRGFSQLEII